MKKHIIINIVGEDRPGIVADVTRIVTVNGGNVGESRAQLLGGYFSLIMQVGVPESKFRGLQDQLKNHEMGLSTGCFDAVDPNMIEMEPRVGCE